MQYRRHRKQGVLESLENRYLLTLNYISHPILISDVDEDQTRSIATADINNDGHLDIVSVGSGPTGNVGWYANLGDGQYARRDFVDLTAASNVLATDVDKDDDLDLVATIESGVVWYENQNGLGEFSASKVLTSTLPRVITAADTDNDGDIDFAMGTSRSLLLLQNNGDGSFSEQTIPSTSGAIAIHLADIDGDLALDIIAGLRDRNVALYSNQGDGLFIEQLVSTSEATINVVTTSDIDDDGDVDVFVADGDRITLLRNTDGLLQKAYETTVLPVGNVGRVRSLAFADLDQNGTTDVIYGLDEFEAFSNDAVIWYPNTDGTGTLNEAFVIVTGFDAGYLVLAEDINKDGLVEIISGGKSMSFPGIGKLGFHQLVNEDTVAFGTQEPVSTQGDGVTWMTLADIDQDGNDDLLTTSHWDGRVAWFQRLSEPDGPIFGPERYIDFEPNARVVLSTDVDADDDLDLLVAARSGGFVYLNDGQGNFPLQVPINTNGTSYIEPGDFDSDGDQDILMITNRTNEFDVEITDLLIYPNLGQVDTAGVPQFAEPITVITHTRTSSIISEQTSEYFSRAAPTFIDVEKDGDLDVVQPLNGGLAIYTNNAGSFSVSVSTVNDSFVQTLPGMPFLITDFDGDGDDDIVREALPVVVFENQGGTFQAKQVALSPPNEFENAERTKLFDLDQDGDLDIISHRHSHADESFDRQFNQLVWYENDGGEFGPYSVLIPDGNTVSAISADIIATDLDTDGDTDLIIGQHSSAVTMPDGGIRWYENRQTGDINDDGNVDFSDFLILSANFGKQDATWSDGDFNADQAVDFADFLAMSATFGTKRNLTA